MSLDQLVEDQDACLLEARQGEFILMVYHSMTDFQERVRRGRELDENFDEGKLDRAFGAQCDRLLNRALEASNPGTAKAFGQKWVTSERLAGLELPAIEKADILWELHQRLFLEWKNIRHDVEQRRKVTDLVTTFMESNPWAGGANGYAGLLWLMYYTQWLVVQNLEEVPGEQDCPVGNREAGAQLGEELQKLFDGVSGFDH